MIVGLLLMVLAIALAWLVTAVLAFLTAARRAGKGATAQAVAWAALGGLVLALPWLLWDGANVVLREQAKARRVPAPLRVERTEYALEDDFGGIGLPGDNETGFVAYRLTPKSVALVRRYGKAVLKSSRFGNWKSTPIVFEGRDGRWHRALREPKPKAPRLASTAAYLDRYGFSIPVEPARLRELDAVINTPGAFYAYGPGGSVTVVDAFHGRVYFIYAG